MVADYVFTLTTNYKHTMTNESEKQEAVEVPALLTLLETVDGGAPLREAEEMLRDIVAESHERGGKGELTLKVKLATTIARGTPKVEVRLEVNGKAPKVPAGVSTFFATADGVLRRDDPAQLELQADMGKNIVRISGGRRGAKAAPQKPEANKPEPQTKKN
jgi:hypothetical protein